MYSIVERVFLASHTDDHLSVRSGRRPQCDKMKAHANAKTRQGKTRQDKPKPMQQNTVNQSQRPKKHQPQTLSDLPIHTHTHIHLLSTRRCHKTFSTYHFFALHPPCTARYFVLARMPLCPYVHPSLCPYVCTRARMLTCTCTCTHARTNARSKRTLTFFYTYMCTCMSQMLATNSYSPRTVYTR